MPLYKYASVAHILKMPLLSSGTLEAALLLLGETHTHCLCVSVFLVLSREFKKRLNPTPLVMAQPEVLTEPI